MEFSIFGMAELAQSECLTLTPYLDSGGVKTVGIGSTISDIKDLPKWPWDKELSIQAAVDIYMKSLGKYVRAVNRALKIGKAKNVKQHEFDALVSFVYNCGVGAAVKKDENGQEILGSTLFRRYCAGVRGSGIHNAFLMWVNDNGRRVQGLVNRRNKEWALFSTGVYPNKGMLDLVPVINKRPNYSKARKINLLNFISPEKAVQSTSEKTSEQAIQSPSPTTDRLENTAQIRPKTWMDVLRMVIDALFKKSV